MALFPCYSRFLSSWIVEIANSKTANSEGRLLSQYESEFDLKYKEGWSLKKNYFKIGLKPRSTYSIHAVWTWVFHIAMHLIIENILVCMVGWFASQGKLLQMHINAENGVKWVNAA